jgi:hypothetical protein
VVGGGVAAEARSVSGASIAVEEAGPARASVVVLPQGANLGGDAGTVLESVLIEAGGAGVRRGAGLAVVGALPGHRLIVLEVPISRNASETAYLSELVSITALHLRLVVKL